MSHVDEGALHAYLDGALDEYPGTEAERIRDHLQTCAQCAIRLEAQRRIRDNATTILEMAAPRMESAPAFEELRAYVKATRPAPSPASVRLYRLGWAASVVLAVGAGWMVRDGQITARAPFAGTMDAVTAAPAEEVLGTSAASDQAGSASIEVARQESGAVGERELARSTGRVSADAPAAPSPAQKIGETAAEAPEASTLAGGGAVVDELVARGFADLDSSAANGVLALDEIVVTGAVVADAEAPAPPPASVVEPEPISVSAARAPVAQGATAAADPEEQRRAETTTRADQPVTALLDVTARDRRARRSSDDEAEEQDEGYFVVPGLELISYDYLAEGTEPSGVHVVQRFADGGMLDLYHLPEGVSPDALPRVESGRNEVTRERAGTWTVLRAAVSTDSLAALLARLDPEERR